MNWKRREFSSRSLLKESPQHPWVAVVSLVTAGMGGSSVPAVISHSWSGSGAMASTRTWDRSRGEVAGGCL